MVAAAAAAATASEHVCVSVWKNRFVSAAAIECVRRDSKREGQGR